MSGTLSNLSNLASIAGVFAAPVAPVLCGAGIAVAAVNFFRQKYQAMYVKSSTTGDKFIFIFIFPCNSPLSALCLGAYIVHLTLIMYNLFNATLFKEPPRPLSRELVEDILNSYRESEFGNMQQLVRNITSGSTLDPREKIADLIRQQLMMDRE